jgi:hypothetical protein
MPQDLFPDPGPDDAEPDGFPPDQDVPGPEQGLYITLPAEQLTLTGFNQGGARRRSGGCTRPSTPANPRMLLPARHGNRIG